MLCIDINCNMNRMSSIVCIISRCILVRLKKKHIIQNWTDVQLDYNILCWPETHGWVILSFCWTLFNFTDYNLKQGDSETTVSSVAYSCLNLCNLMDCSTPGLPVHHQLPVFTQAHVHWVGDAIQPFHPPSSPFPSAFNLSQHQSLFKWVSSLH